MCRALTLMILLELADQLTALDHEPMLFTGKSHSG